MKKSVKLYTADKVKRILQQNKKIGVVCLRPKILENGDFTYVGHTSGRFFDAKLTANEVAFLLGVSLWEVVMVDDWLTEYALLTYEN